MNHRRCSFLSLLVIRHIHFTKNPGWQDMNAFTFGENSDFLISTYTPYNGDFGHNLLLPHTIFNLTTTGGNKTFWHCILVAYLHHNYVITKVGVAIKLFVVCKNKSEKAWDLLPRDLWHRHHTSSHLQCIPVSHPSWNRATFLLWECGKFLGPV